MKKVMRFLSPDEKTRIDDFKMTATIAQEKRKLAYSELKKWDAKRTELLSLHHRLTIELYDKCLTIVDQSSKNIEIYSQFFKGRAEMESYLSQSTKFTKFEGQFEPIFQKENNFSVKMKQKMLILNNNILRDKLQKFKNRSSKIELIISNFQNSKKVFEQRSQQLQKIGNLLAATYMKGLLNVNPLVCEQDLTILMLQYLKSAQMQTQSERLMGIDSLEMFKQALSFEKLRNLAVQESIKIYQNQFDLISTSSQYDPVNELNKIFDLKSLVDNRILNLIKLQLRTQSQNFNVNNLQLYIKLYKFQQFPTKFISLKQYDAVFKLQGNPISEQKCNVILTVNGYLHCVGIRQRYSLPFMSLKVDETFMLKSLSNIQVEIKKKDQKKKGVFGIFKIDLNVSAFLKFFSKDIKQQFCMFIKKMI